MAKRKKNTLSKAILRLIFGIPAMVSLFATIRSLLKHEVRLAGQSLLRIIVLTLFSALLLSSSWLCVLAVLFVYLISLQWPLYSILLVLLGINFLMFLIILLILRHYKANLSFPETRRLLSDVRHIFKEFNH